MQNQEQLNMITLIFLCFYLILLITHKNVIMLLFFNNIKANIRM